MPGHPRHPSAGIKQDALRRCFEFGEDVEYVSRAIGYNRVSIYKWRRSYLEKGGAGLMSARRKIQREPLVSTQISELPAPTDVVRLQNQMDKLQMEVAILHETIHVLKKTQALI